MFQLPQSIITIGGNIGCGKTTLLNKLQQEVKTIHNQQVNYFLEPIEKWNPWLDMFYMNPDKYAFPFQMKILQSFVYFKNIRDMFCLNVTERSPLDAREVFSRSLMKTNKLTYLEHNLFCEFFDIIGWKPKTYIYIQTDPQICNERMKKRNRECETGVSLQYLKDIHDEYESFIKNYEHEINIHIVDGNRDIESVFEDVKNILNKETNPNMYMFTQPLEPLSLTGLHI